MPLTKLTTLSWLYDLYRLGHPTLDPDSDNRMYQQILQHIVNGFDGKNGCLALTSEDGMSLSIVAGIDLPPSVIGKTIEIGEAILGAVVKDGTPVLLNGEASEDPRFQSRAVRDQTTTPSSAMCWPLKVEEMVIGTISVNRLADKPAFTIDDLQQGSAILNLVSLILTNIKLQMDQQRRIAELKQTNKRLEEAQSQLLQSEKMASIGQLAAGVAHELNNPIGFVFSNLGTLDKYLTDLFDVLASYERMEEAVGSGTPVLASVQKLKQQVDLAFLKEDIPALMAESRDGITRVKSIVQNLKDFSHASSDDEWQWADIHRTLDSTINIVWNELKYKTQLKKDYGDLPDIECLPSQLSQVFLNLLVNAGQAIEQHGVIAIRTAMLDQQVMVEISDNGTGIAPENLHRVFDPFFTTKKIGEGTGLGLSLSYGIIQKHGGRIEVSSKLGAGTTFRIFLPIRRVKPEPASAVGVSTCA